MKKIFAFSFLISTVALAQVHTIKGRIYTGRVNPELSTFGAIVDLSQGEVLYVTAVISVLDPSSMDKNCMYEFNYTLNRKTKYKSITLVPPVTVIACDLDLPTDK